MPNARSASAATSAPPAGFSAGTSVEGLGRRLREVPADERPRERLAKRGAAGLSAAELVGLVWGSGRPGISRGRPRDGGPRPVRRPDRPRPCPEAGARGGAGRRRRAGGPAGRRPSSSGGGSLADWPAGRWTIRAPARRRRPARAPDGPPRARGAAGRAPQHEERRAARGDRLPGQRLGRPRAGRRAVPRRGPARRRGHHPRPQPPVGRPDAAPDDLHLTAEALAAGRLLDIDVLDHLVIGHDAYV